jgi:predicted nucleotidyltransferase
VNLAVSSEELKSIRTILQQLVPNAAVVAFGSRIRGTHAPYSDLDLAIDSGEPLELSTLAKLTDAFSDSQIPYKVDIVDVHRISEEFRSIIKQHLVTIQAGSLAAAQT